jgi:hypothetical protein
MEDFEVDQKENKEFTKELPPVELDLKLLEERN